MSYRVAIIPAAGEGVRFKEAGYTTPKPFIDVFGKPMLDRVIETLPYNIDKYIIVCRSEHEKYLERLTTPKDKLQIVRIDRLTDGAARTVLMAIEQGGVHKDSEVVVANSDQYVLYNKDNFEIIANQIDGGIILVFPHSHPRWSYVELDDFFHVKRVVEKEPISNLATAGIYFYRVAEDLVNSVKSMINKNIRTNGEFYFAPSFNELINGHDYKFVLPFHCDRMSGLGTPADLDAFLNTGRVNQ